MGTVTTAACRSYSALTFDGCPACVGAALDAIVQAGMFTLGRTAPGMAGQVEGPLEMEYALRVRLTDELGGEIGADEIVAEQTVSAIGIGGEEDGGTVEETDEAEAGRVGDRARRLDAAGGLPDGPGPAGAGPGRTARSVWGHRRTPLWLRSIDRPVRDTGFPGPLTPGPARQRKKRPTGSPVGRFSLWRVTPDLSRGSSSARRRPRSRGAGGSTPVRWFGASSNACRPRLPCSPASCSV